MKYSSLHFKKDKDCKQEEYNYKLLFQVCADASGGTEKGQLET